MEHVAPQRISKTQSFPDPINQPLYHGEQTLVEAKHGETVSVDGSDLPLPHHRHALELIASPSSMQ